MLLFHAEPVLSSGEDVELYRFASFVPSFIESCCRERCDEDVAVGNRKEERRGIVWHRCCCGIAWVDTSSKIRLALGVVLHHCPHDHSSTSGKACYSDTVGIKTPLSGMLSDETNGLTTIFFGPRPGLLCCFITHRRLLFAATLKR